MTRKLPAACLPSSSKISLKSSSSEKFDVDMDGPEVSPEAAVQPCLSLGLTCLTHCHRTGGRTPRQADAPTARRPVWRVKVVHRHRRGDGNRRGAVRGLSGGDGAFTPECCANLSRSPLVFVRSEFDSLQVDPNAAFKGVTSSRLFSFFATTNQDGPETSGFKYLLR